MPSLTRTATNDAYAYSTGTYNAIDTLLDLGDTSSTPDSYVAIQFGDIQVDRYSRIDDASFVMNLNLAPSNTAVYRTYLYATINPSFPADAPALRGAPLTTTFDEQTLTTSSSTGNLTWSIKAALQEQVNKDTWVKGSSVVVLLRTQTAGMRRSIHRSLENSTGTYTQLLTVNFTPPAPFSGTGSPTPPTQTASGSGASSNPETTGTGSASAPSQTSSGTGSSANAPVTGSGSAAGPAETALGTGSSSNPETSGAGTASPPTQTATGTGATESEPPFVATGEAAAPVESASGTGSSDAPAFAGEGVAINPEPAATGGGSTYLPPPKFDEPLSISPQSELASAIARHMLGLLPPGRKPKEGGRAFFTVLALSALLAEADEAALEMIFSWSPSRTSGEDLLALIGRARGIKRGRGEPFEAYRARVVGAAAFWRLGGTVQGVIAALETAGYGVRVTEHYLTDKARWAEFSIDLFPGRSDFTADTWDDPEGYWNDGTPWDWGISTAEGERIRDIIREMKAAHSKVRSVLYQHGGLPDYWDDDHGAWDDESFWYGFEPIRVL